MKLRHIYGISLIALMILLITPAAFAVVDEPEDLLPRDNVVGVWQKDDTGLYFYDYSLGRILGEEVAGIVEEYGFLSLYSQYYYEDLNYMEFRIFELDSPEEAFGLYSIFPDIPRDPGEVEIIFGNFELKLGLSSTPEMCWINETEMLLLGDNFIVQMIAEDEGYKLDMLTFALKIQAKFDILGGELGNIDSLERDDRIHGAERLIAGYETLNLYMRIGNFDPFLLGEEDVRCIMADYRSEVGRIFRQLVVEYPDEELAKEGYAAFKNWIDGFYFIRRQNIIDSHNSYYAIDENEKYMGGFRDGRFLRVFFGFEDIDELRDIISGYS